MQRENWGTQDVEEEEESDVKTRESNAENSKSGNNVGDK